MMMNINLEKIKPGIPKVYLYFLAGSIWAYAGIMLMYRGMHGTSIIETPITTLALLPVLGGIFYWFMFRRISSRYINRIELMSQSRPCAFAFFSYRSYMMMALMISTGILMGTIPSLGKYYSLFLIVMGIPLFISSLRFFLSGIKNRN
ncbi:MAG: hypothetical protein JEZ03_13570 [Bacteroidales bacterium]|nr:hypothetical protein [Bacteroidales bacterium]